MRPVLTERQLRGLNLRPPGKPLGAPVLDPLEESSTGPYGAPGTLATPGCGATRVQLAGGFLNACMVHTAVTPFERLYRARAEEGMFSPTVSPENPFAFELGAFRAPETFGLMLFDLRGDVYRFSGVDATDTVPVERRRFSTIMGFEVTIDQHQPANLLYELEPVPIQTFQQAFEPPLSPLPDMPSPLMQILGVQDSSRFDLARSTSFAAASGAGDQLQPQRPTRYGALSVPFMLYIGPGQTFQVRCVVFHPLPHPIAFVEYDIAGMMMPDIWVRYMLECMKPLSNESAGPGSLGGGPR